jgi:hypothetical protein
MSGEQAKPDRLGAFRKALDLVVVGEPVELKSVKGEDGRTFHVKPRKLSKKNAARVRRLAVETATDLSPGLQAKMRRLRRDHPDGVNEAIIEAELSDDEMAELTKSSDPSGRYEIVHAKILYGIAEHDFGGEYEPMTEDVVDLILESEDLAAEMLELVDDMNPPFAKGTSESSET